MRKILVASFAGMLAALATPVAGAAAQAPRTAAAVNRDLSLVGAWMTQIQEALQPANAAIAASEPKLKAIVASVHDAASARAAAAEMRGLLQAQRAAIAGAQSNLDAIPAAPASGAHVAGIDVTVVLRDARALLVQLLRYNDALTSFSDAAEKGDVAAIRAAMPVIARGGLLILDGQVTVFRNRQGLFPADNPAHQMTGLTAALYESMAIVQRASLRNALERQPDAAAAEERAALVEMEERVAGLTRAGRQNLDRFRKDIPRAAGADEAQLVAKITTFVAAEEAFFAVGDELAAWARTEARETEAARALPGASQAFHRLYEMEQKLGAIQRAAAAAMAARP